MADLNPRLRRPMIDEQGYQQNLDVQKMLIRTLALNESQIFDMSVEVVESIPNAAVKVTWRGADHLTWAEWQEILETVAGWR